MQHRGESPSGSRFAATTAVPSEEWLRLLLDAARGGLWEVDLISRRMMWSPEMYELFGRNPAAEPPSLETLLTEIVHPADRELVQSFVRQIEVSGQSSQAFELEYRIVRPDGAIVWLMSLARVQWDERGEPIRAQGITREITARKQIEQARSEREEFIRNVTELTPDLVFVADLEQRRTIYTNRRFMQQLGYGNELPNESFDAFIERAMHPDDLARRPALRRAIQDLADHVTLDEEIRYQHADGTWRWFRTRLSVFSRTDDGRVRQIIGTATDVTEHRQAQEELHRLNAELEQHVAARTAELIAANRELEAFAYSVSHDLRAPLRAIDGYSAALASFSTQIPQDAQRYLGRIHGGVQRMGELIDALLGLSQVTRRELTFQPVDLSALARAVVTELRRADPGRDVEVVIAGAVSALGDTRLLRIVLDNLLGNAWKFTAGRERPRIEFGVHVVRGERTYYVRDNGAGFDMAWAANRLFAPFQRFHRAEEFSGTGIGLATVQRIVTRHGGRISADSAPGAGATFSFTLASDRAHGYEG